MTPAGARESPPLGLILPFFLVAPLGLVAAGVMLALTGSDSLTAVNSPELLAATHAAVLGWLCISIMGAIFQLGPVLFGGRIISAALVRGQLAAHAGGVAVMVVAFGAWRTEALAMGGMLTAASFAVFVVNAAFAVRWFARGALVRHYVSVSLLFLVATAALGLSYVLALNHGWFPLTFGRVAAHAHLGLVGFLAITIMGVSYQLVPMFQLTPHVEPRFGRLVLPWMAIAAALFAAVMWTNPPAAARVAVTAALAGGAVLWITDITTIIRRRAKRTFDIQGKATIASLVFLGAALAVALVAASGKPAALTVEHQRLQLSYALLGIGGWAGTTILGNSFKIVPFLVWNGRFRELAGKAPVPTLAQLLNGRLAQATLWCLCAAVTVGATSAASGWLPGLRVAGLLFAVTGCLQFATEALVAARRPAAGAAASAPSRRIPT